MIKEQLATEQVEISFGDRLRRTLLRVGTVAGALALAVVLLPDAYDDVKQALTPDYSDIHPGAPFDVDTP